MSNIPLCDAKSVSSDFSRKCTAHAKIKTEHDQQFCAQCGDHLFRLGRIRKWRWIGGLRIVEDHGPLGGKFTQQ